jgi:hypothetical protein
VITAHDGGAQSDATVEPAGDRFQARWTSLIVGGPIARSETAVKDFDQQSEAWAWVDDEASRRGFHWGAE